MSQCLSKETSLLQNTPEEIFTYKFYGQSNNLMDCSFKKIIDGTLICLSSFHNLILKKELKI